MSEQMTEGSQQAVLAGVPGRVEFLPAIDLKLDYLNYQRSQNAAKVERMAANFRSSGMGTLLVSRRADGDYLMDGGHRRVVALQRLGPNALVKCEVYEGLTIQQEAETFYLVNSERNTMTTLQRFRSAYRGSDAEVIRIAATLDGLGIDYPWAPLGRTVKAENTIFCWVTLQFIYRREGDGYLRNLLLLIQDTWEGDGDSLSGLFIKGVDHLLRCHGSDENWSDDEFVRRLQLQSPAKVLRDGQAKSRRSPHIGIAEVLHEQYNRGRRVRRLDDFRIRPNQKNKSANPSEG